jgi:hypothetical protein
MKILLLALALVPAAAFAQHSPSETSVRRYKTKNGLTVLQIETNDGTSVQQIFRVQTRDGQWHELERVQRVRGTNE